MFNDYRKHKCNSLRENKIYYLINIDEASRVGSNPEVQGFEATRTRYSLKY